MFLTHRFYWAMGLTALVMASGMFFGPMLIVGKWLLVALFLVVIFDALVVYARVRMAARRDCPERFSLGDENEVAIVVANRSPLSLHLEVIDELPFQFQKRDFSIKGRIGANEGKTFTYTLRPTERGVYAFGRVLLYVSSMVGMVQRCIRTAEPFNVKVYPSFLMLRKYELMALSNNFSEMGIKRIRRAGNNTEFEQIRDYVQGDDYRTINWKASARRSRLMVNAYQDERSQQIFSVIDKGRMMQQTFNGMTLLDYSINAALVLSYVAINKQDKAGLITFADKFDTFVPADRKTTQMQLIQENLYHQQTVFGESDYSMLCPNVNKLVGRRSFMMLYTNFTDFGSLERQLPYLVLFNTYHRLLVVFFEDMELNDFTRTPSESMEDLYQHVVAEKLVYERRLIANTLMQNGIYCLLTTPNKLSVDVINKYMEMKSRQLLG
ncbi:MAG: DUF58 domain-containing protein [Prevotella sp.]|nr:DUF58 domain-containing protein [Prevotella sp.]